MVRFEFLRPIQTGRVKLSGLACFGRVREKHWIRKLSILLVLCCELCRSEHGIKLEVTQLPTVTLLQLLFWPVSGSPTL